MGFAALNPSYESMGRMGLSNAKPIPATPQRKRYTRKLSPQPQRPFSFGLVKVNPDSSAFTS